MVVAAIVVVGAAVVTTAVVAAAVVTAAVVAIAVVVAAMVAATVVVTAAFVVAAGVAVGNSPQATSSIATMINNIITIKKGCFVLFIVSSCIGVASRLLLAKTVFLADYSLAD